MANFSSGNFSVNLGFVSLGASFDDADRQLAWELYVEMMSRVAVRGKVDSEGYENFTGEILAESLESMYHFFKEVRALARRFPVGAIGVKQRDHLGFFAASMLEVVFRPFLEKWQAEFRHWWRMAYDDDQPRRPTVVQLEFPELDEMLLDWTNVRRFVRDAANELAAAYKLTDLAAAMPDDLRYAMLRTTPGPTLRRK